MLRFERVVLYIGAPKTGTTTVQAFLRTNEAALLAQGIYIPKVGRGGIGQHIELPTFVHTQRKRNGLDRHADLKAGDIEARTAAFQRDLDDELASVPRCHTVLFFSEYMFSSNLKEIRAYKEIFAGRARRFESLMYLRRQDQWLASLTLQARKSGARHDLKMNKGSPPNYAGGIRAWDTESDACHIRRLDRQFMVEGSLLKDFCHVMGIDARGLDTEEVRANPSILQEQVELVDHLNAAIAQMRFQRQLLYRTRFISLCTDTLRGTAIQFDRKTAVRAFISFKVINTWLRETRDPGGPKTFFNTDFTAYSDDVKNDRLYTAAQLVQLLSVVAGLLEEKGLPTFGVPPKNRRGMLIRRVVQSYLALRESELEERRQTRLNANMMKDPAARPSGETAVFRDA